MRGDTQPPIVLVVLDGAADRPSASLGGATPLEAAETPNLDRLAAAGTSGLLDVSAPGTPLSSDRAHALLFGYDHGDVPGRGVLEARGFDVEPGDVACSASFAQVIDRDDRFEVIDRKVTAERERCAAVAGRVDVFGHEGVRVELAYTWKNRGIVTLSADEPLSPAVTDVDPFEAGLPVVDPRPTRDAADPDAAARTADALRAYTRWTLDRLASGPVDVVLSKWAASPTDPEPFAARHGLSAASVTRKPTLRGLAETLGMDLVDPTDEDDYGARADAAAAALDDHEFVHVHYPEPDEVAHAASPRAKRDEIAAIDASLAPLVDRLLADEVVAVVTADHTTPSVGNVVHSGEPVPVTMTGRTVRTDAVETVGERPAAGGDLGRLRGRDLLRLARAAADRVYLDGLRRTPAVRSYPVRDVPPLRRDP